MTKEMLVSDLWSLDDDRIYWLAAATYIMCRIQLNRHKHYNKHVPPEYFANCVRVVLQHWAVANEIGADAIEKICTSEYKDPDDFEPVSTDEIKANFGKVLERIWRL